MHSSGRKRSLIPTILRNLVVTTLCCFIANHAQAQTDKQDKRAALVVILNLLLEEEAIFRPEGNLLKLNLGEVADQPLLATPGDPAVLEFDRQAEGVELCFDLSGSSIPNSGAIQIMLNGVAQTARLGKDNCFVVPVGQQRGQNFVTVSIAGQGARLVLRRIELAQSNPIDELGLPTSSRGSWNNRAVRKVLKIFAYGGHATDAQIQTWADMPAREAIGEMLNFNEYNPRLSPLIADDRVAGYGEIYSRPGNGTFGGFIDYISDPASTHPLSQRDRNFFKLSERRFGISETFQRFMVVRGLNPFRQRIGFWETNYHLAVNLNAGVQDRQMQFYYDEVMNAHAENRPYYEVIGVAAKSAAVATQYGHRFNDWDEREQICFCNDDFAREVHQLFYGIFGLDDPDEHENVTIKQTARLLTGMGVNRDGNVLDTVVNFDTPETNERRQPQHHEGPVTVLGQSIAGRTAAEKLDNLMPISMQHPESLENLPIMIVEVLADNNLSEASKNRLRNAWAALGVERRFLDYIHAYAISRVFHSPEQVKFFTSFDRAFYTANRYNISQAEALYSGRGNLELRVNFGKENRTQFRDDKAGTTFEPLNNVFGGQTAQEAAGSQLVFEGNFNRIAADREIDYRNRYRTRCGSCNNGNAYFKDWSQVIPPENGGYTADYVARWMWRHIVGHLDDYTELERAHLVSIIGANSIESTADVTERFAENRFWDLNYLLCIRADKLDRGETVNGLYDIMGNPNLPDGGDNAPWSSRCNINRVDPHSPAEREAFNLVVTADMVRNTPYIRDLVNELGTSPVRLKQRASGGLNEEDAGFIRLRANERIQAAALFIMATPFVFAEAQN